MTAATEFLFRLGMSALFAGFNLWIVLFFVATFRDPKGSEILAWSINTQWAASARILRRAAGFRFWGRLASGVMALGVTCLILSGLLAAIHLFLDGTKG